MGWNGCVGVYCLFAGVGMTREQAIDAAVRNTHSVYNLILFMELRKCGINYNPDWPNAVLWIDKVRTEFRRIMEAG